MLGNVLREGVIRVWSTQKSLDADAGDNIIWVRNKDTGLGIEVINSKDVWCEGDYLTFPT